MKLYFKTTEMPDTAQVDDLSKRLRDMTAEFKPFSKELSMEERRFSRKMGDRRLAYADAAERYGDQYESVMPRTFAKEDMSQRLEFHRKLTRFKDSAIQLMELLDDTLMSCGIDLMTYTKLVHDGLRSANNINPIYDEALHRLDEFNKRVTLEEEAEAEQQGNTVEP